MGAILRGSGKGTKDLSQLPTWTHAYALLLPQGGGWIESKIPLPAFDTPAPDAHLPLTQTCP